MTRVLVTGATGYIGGRLVPELLAAGYDVRVLARNPQRLGTRPWRAGIDVVEGDASDPAALTRAVDCVDVAYYLIHSMGAGRRFEERDRRTALAFGAACREAGVGRIVYLGGLHPDGEELSPHLGSRREVGEILLACGVPTTVLRAAVIIGSGSASFEMLRYLTERLPVMITPRWLDTRIQPIAVRDVLHYLVGSARMPTDVNRGFDIGGPDVLTYRADDAAVRRRGRACVRAGSSTVPLLTPSLSSHWVGLVTPVPTGIARPLVDSLVHEVVCKDHDIDAVRRAASGRRAIGFDRAVALALKKVQDLDVEYAVGVGVDAGRAERSVAE